MAFVLVVEDDHSLRSGMKALLGLQGHRVAMAASVAEAAAQLDAATPTHLLLDLNLPDGPGTQILRRIRAQQLPVRVAILSGGSDSVLMDEGRALGADAVFIKPPNWDNVCDWVAEV
jgi:DNA-binding response OmpR family regulator